MLLNRFKFFAAEMGNRTSLSNTYLRSIDPLPTTPPPKKGVGGETEREAHYIERCLS